MVQFLNYNIYLIHFRNKVFLSGPFCPLSMSPTFEEYICLGFSGQFLHLNLLGVAPHADSETDPFICVCAASKNLRVVHLKQPQTRASVSNSKYYVDIHLDSNSYSLNSPFIKNHGVFEEKCALSKFFQNSKVLIQLLKRAKQKYLNSQILPTLSEKSLEHPMTKRNISGHKQQQI